MNSSNAIWTDQQFAEMSWHDNHVHGLQIVARAHGSGELILDIDSIEDWIQAQDGSFEFRIRPSRLCFHEVYDLRIEVDFKAATAALGPFSIHTIRREEERREAYVALVWTIEINWPKGEISFLAAGFTQNGVGEAVTSRGQYLTPVERC